MLPLSAADKKILRLSNKAYPSCYFIRRLCAPCKSGYIPDLFARTAKLAVPHGLAAERATETPIPFTFNFILFTFS